MTCALLGVGTALPTHYMEQEEAAKSAAIVGQWSEEMAARTGKLYRITSIERRYSVLLEHNGRGLPHERQTFFPLAQDTADAGPRIGARMEQYEREAAPLAAAASRKALVDAGVAPEDVTHVVTVSCSGFTAPGIEIHLMKTLGLRPTTERTHVGFMGCHGALNGLRVARAFCESTPGAIVLVAAVELCTIHYHYQWDVQKNVANALFADGAAAVVLGSPAREPDLERFPAPAAQLSPHPTPLPPGEGAGPVWRCAAAGSCIIPGSEDAMTWRIRDHGFAMTLSQEVPALIQAHLRPWMVQWLLEHGSAIKDIRTWAVHPGGPTILKASANALGLSRADLAASWDALREFGNMSSPTLLFILEALRRQQAPLPCVLLGFGPGLAAEAVLFE